MAQQAHRTDLRFQNLIQNLDRPTLGHIKHDDSGPKLNQSAIESFEILVMSLNNLDMAVKGLEYRLIKNHRTERQLTATPPPRSPNWTPMAFILGAGVAILTIKLSEKNRL